MYPSKAQGLQAMEGQIQTRRRDVTLRQNLDDQIEMAKQRLEELEAARARLDGMKILDARIDDLQQAMSW